MVKFPSRFRRLDDILADLPDGDDAMMLSDLDGFLTGVILCPAPILPGEWLPYVWGGSTAAPFDDPGDMLLFTDMVKARHTEIARDLKYGRLQPIFDVDGRNGEVLWELWIEGLATAMALRPDSWADVAAGGDAEAGDALATLQLLIAVARNESDLMSSEINQLCDAAPDLVARHVKHLYAWRLQHAPPADVPDIAPGKIGRNVACPCGSGRKYKRCCGFAA